ncbi:MAG TPA: aminoacyl-tRNA hydrolase [Blastocatellia bacterium]|nr:aminoacyl-tRNA hydrolase [Blastocatellia bacterium]
MTRQFKDNRFIDAQALTPDPRPLAPVLVAGLGNPGREYEATRHNLGFLLIDRLFGHAGGRRFRDEMNAKVAEVEIAGRRVLLVKPQTYMNLSGSAVGPLLERYADGDPARLIVACDDVALPFGMIRVRARGSAGGQKGLKSIIDRLGTQVFARVRLGVKPDHPIADLSRYVLSPISKRDREQLETVLERAADAVAIIMTDGVERAQSLYNERVKTVTVEE